MTLVKGTFIGLAIGCLLVAIAGGIIHDAIISQVGLSAFAGAAALRLLAAIWE